MGHGRHIKIVGNADPTKLGSVDNVKEFLINMVAALGMRPLGEPILHDVELDLAKLNVEPFEDEGGVTGVCVLSTSHCAIHTWPLRNEYVLDVYSCRDFAPLTVIAQVDRAFGVGDKNITDLALLGALRKPSELNSSPELR